MSGGKGGGGSKQTTKIEPWGEAQPYLGDILKEAQKFYNQGYGTAQYPYDTVAPTSQYTTSGIGQIAERAAAGSPLQQPLQQGMREILSGDRLMEGNPYFSAMAGRVRDEVMPGINATFGGMGRTGGGLHQESLSKGLGDSIGALAYQNYGDEADRQLKAMAMAPGIMANDYADANALLGIGGLEQQRAQEFINADVERFNFEENAPWSLLGRYADLAYPAAGMGRTETGKAAGPGGNPIGGALSGGLLGYGIGTSPMMASLGGSMMPWAMGGPIGAAAGAGLGLLGALL